MDLHWYFSLALAILTLIRPVYMKFDVFGLVFTIPVLGVVVLVNLILLGVLVDDIGSP